MIVYKMYRYQKFEEVHKDYFDSLLNVIRQKEFFSPNIDEIIITDDIDGEMGRYFQDRIIKPNLTREREFKGVAKTVRFEDKRKIFFDAKYVNSFVEYTPQVFLRTLIDVYAEDLVGKNLKVPDLFFAETEFKEILKMHFLQWASKVVSNDIEKTFSIPRQELHTDVKMFVDTFKRNMRQLHYRYQADVSIDTFSIDSIKEVDFFIRRCFDVKHDDGSFDNLQEFLEIVPALLSEIQVQTQNLLNKKEIDWYAVGRYVLDILNKCSIDVPYEGRMYVNILDTPKKLFKNTIVDTEPRIVAFLDILGFSAIVEEYESDSQSNILNELHDALDEAINTSLERMIDPEAKTEVKEYLEYRMFSDCICISLPFIEFGSDFHVQFYYLSTIVSSYQLAMMQKGFFVRGGISIGSFYADKHMIFSGGLVNAYQLEQKAIYPVIAVDEKVIERLKMNFSENTQGMFYENILLFSDSEPAKIFINPFHLLDNSVKNLDYLSTIDNLMKENKEEEEDGDELSEMTNSLLEITNSFVNPSFDYIKAQMTPEQRNSVKHYVLEQVNQQLKKYNKKLLECENDCKEVQKVIDKYERLKLLIEWSMGSVELSLFKYYHFR